MMSPKYFKQQRKYTCSLAVLRQVLHINGIQVREDELVKKVEKDYGKKFGENKDIAKQQTPQEKIFPNGILCTKDKNIRTTDLSLS